MSENVILYSQVMFVSDSGDTHMSAVRKFDNEKLAFVEMSGSPKGNQQFELSIKIPLIAGDWEDRGYKTSIFIRTKTIEGGKEIEQRLIIHEDDTTPTFEEVFSINEEVQEIP